MAVPAIAARLAGGGGGAAAWANRLGQAGNVLATVKNTLPVIEEQMEVTVFGDHEAKKSELYALAVSLIWGQITRRNLVKLLPPAGTIMIEYSLEENAVRAVVRLQTSYLDALVASAVNPAARKYQVFDGPSDGPYKGGRWQWQSQLPGLKPPRVTTGWEGRTILTNEPTYEDRAGTTRKTQSPAPPGDGVARGVDTIASNEAGGKMAYNPSYLLFTALSLPCSTAGMTRNNSASAVSPAEGGHPGGMPPPVLPPGGTLTTNGPG